MVVVVEVMMVVVVALMLFLVDVHVSESPRDNCGGPILYRISFYVLTRCLNFYFHVLIKCLNF